MGCPKLPYRQTVERPNFLGVWKKSGQSESCDNYYAFGLTFNSYQRENAKKNKYLYNGGAERQDDLDLGIDLTFYRAYDPSMCRWWQIDPKVDNMEGWTPYNYSFNNPIRYNDPKGDCPPGVDCENFVKGAWNSVKAVGQFAADTWNSKGQNLVDAANNLEMVATVASVAPGAVVDKIAGDFKQSMANTIAETGSTQGAASQILGEVTGGVILGAVTDKGLSKLGTVAKVVDKVADVTPDAGNLGNPFKGKTLEQVQGGFEKQVSSGKLEPKYTSPVSGSKSYVNKKSGYSYNVDTGKSGKTGAQVESPHVDVNYPNPKPTNVPPKKKLPLE